MLESVTECYRVLQSITENSRVLQNIKEYYRVFLEHLLGPISGLVYNPPPLPAAFIFLYYSKFDFIKAAKNKKCLANFLEFKLDLLILNLGGADGHTI